MKDQASQRGGLTTLECTPFGHLGQHRQGGGGAHPGERLQRPSAPIQRDLLLAQLLQLLFNLLQILLQATDQALGLAAQHRRARRLGLLALGHPQL